MSAFAALVLLCVASSCKDQNFDRDNVHAINYQEKFTDSFIKEFGQPAEGHQWGFDKPWMDKFITRADTRAVIAKVESEYVPYMDTYGTAPNITNLEHKEVFEWFSTHKVTWEKTTQAVGHYNQGDRLEIYSEGYIAKELIYKEYNYEYQPGDFIEDWRYNSFSDEEKSKVERGGAWHEAGASAEPYYGARVVKSNGTIIEGDFLYPQNQNPDTRIIQLVSGAGNRGTNTLTPAVSPSDNRLPAENSIWTYSPEMAGTCNVGLVINFTSAWVQHVASEIDSTLPEVTKDISAYDDAKLDSETRYDYLQFYGKDGEALHTNDFNGQLGYGWGQQPKHTLFGKEYDFNGDLILGADFTNTTVHNSKDSKLHDKWIIVYLKGEDYEGWYLGFDLEGAGKNQSMCIKADGYCNNWIIKLTAVNEAVSTEPVRIMCEDLGGEANKVQIGDKVHISDIDYNDIVLDVTPDKTNKHVTLTLQAAGGTIPLTVWYNKQPLFETHEMFQAGKTFNDDNHKDGINYTIMYNTVGENRATTTDGMPARTYNLTLGDLFDINKLELKVWRLDTDSYKESAPNDFSDALWVNINNIAGQAPLKICVPQFVPWLKERCSIKDGYPDFVDWVKDPSELFWGTKDGIVESKIHSQYLVR